MSTTSYQPRGNKTVGDIVRSLVPLVVLVVLAVWLLWPKAGSRVQVVDPSGTLRDAARVGLYTVVTPHGLPAGWQPTSSTVDQPTDRVLTVEVGYYTPGRKYARYVQSNAPTAGFVGDQVPGSVPDGSAVVAGVSWQRYRTPSAEIVLVRPGPVSLLVTGSAGLDELTELAASLR
jgi:Protein of unknown function (DUF4245)